MDAITLSMLDQSPSRRARPAPQALHNSLELARLAERLGYHRYWVAEHHGTPGSPAPHPEVLIGPIGAATPRLRLGSGGVMLPHYSPLKVAEAFSTLAGLYPGRIDLGLGRAPGSDPLTTLALQRDRRQRSPDDFPQQLAELLAYFDDTLPGRPPVRAAGPLLPGRPERPEPWLLGSSPQSAIWAAELGLPYAFADFINPHGAAIAARYREEFTPSAALRSRASPSPAGRLCAETDEEARAARLELADDVPAAAPGPADPGAAGGEALAFLDAQGARRTPCRDAGARSWAHPRRCARACWGSSRSTAPPR